MKATWKDVLNRRHSMTSTRGDTKQEFLRALHGMIGPQMPIKLDGVDGVLTSSATGAVSFLPKQT